MKHAFRLCVLFAIAISFARASTGAPTSRPMESPDGMPFGEFQPIKGFVPPTLPSIGRVLGVPVSQWSSYRRVISRTHSSGQVEQIEKRENVNYPQDCILPEFVVTGLSGTFIAFNVDQGRIADVYFGGSTLTRDRREAIADAINNSGHGMKPPVEAIANVAGSTCVNARFRRDEWYILSHMPPANIAAAIRNQVVIVGMDEDQADAAMWNLQPQTDSDAGDSKQISYYSWSGVGALGEGGSIHKVVHLSVSLQDGKVARVDKLE